MSPSNVNDPVTYATNVHPVANAQSDQGLHYSLIECLRSIHSITDQCRLIRLCGCAGWTESTLVTYVIRSFSSWRHYNAQLLHLYYPMAFCKKMLKKKKELITEYKTILENTHITKYNTLLENTYIAKYSKLNIYCVVQKPTWPDMTWGNLINLQGFEMCFCHPSDKRSNLKGEQILSF